MKTYLFFNKGKMGDMIGCLGIRLEAIECPNDCNEYKATGDCEHLQRIIERKNRLEKGNNKQILY